MTCLRLPGAVVCLAGPVHEIEDSYGKPWRFEMTYFGPVVIRKDGDPVKTQPPYGSRFWPAFEKWLKENKGGGHE